ncbi:hypothetical protein SAMN02745830_04558 [Streptomyces sp. Amel2xC10]|nr:hypothetical protein SAMN02745830_04558 [Streptomyces sp. Amel2xC10]
MNAEDPTVVRRQGPGGVGSYAAEVPAEEPALADFEPAEDDVEDVEEADEDDEESEDEDVDDLDADAGELLDEEPRLSLR